MIQGWTINVLVIRLRGRIEKGKNGQKRHRTKTPKDKTQSGQNPQKREDILILIQLRCMIPWSHDTGVDNQHSCHVITCFGQRKAKMDKNAVEKKPLMIKLKAGKTPKKRKYFNTPTIKVYYPMITWYRGGQSTFSLCDYVGLQRKAKMDKSAIGQKPQRIKLKVDKTLKKWKYFNTPTFKVYDPMITWYRGGQSTFSSCDHVGEQTKAKNGQKRHRTKPQRIKLKADKTIKKRTYFNTPTIKVYDPMITWYRGGQSTFSSCDHVNGQTKAKMDKSDIGQKQQRIKLKTDKTPKKRKYFNTVTIKVYDYMITWYSGGQSTFSSCDHVGGQRKAKMDKSAIGQKPQRIKLKVDKTPQK